MDRKLTYNEGEGGEIMEDKESKDRLGGELVL